MNKDDARLISGQRMIAGFSGLSVPTDFIENVKRCKIGNAILFSRNIESSSQVRELCAELDELIVRETGIRPLISIDQEGGMVSRLSPDCPNIPGAMALASCFSTDQAFNCALINASLLRSLGINFNLSPVCDINSNPDNPVIGVRSFSDNPETVGAYTSAIVEGQRQGGVLSCLKHFPGHGDTSVDSHLGLPIVSKSLEELEAVELAGFRQAIKAGAETVMLSHILYTALPGGDRPATMNPFLVNYLRTKMGLDGLILTDCMEMGAIQESIGTPNGVLEALRAGVDIAGISHTTSLQALSLETVLAHPEVLEGPSFDRILQVKKNLFAKEARPFSQEDESYVRDLGRQAIVIVENKSFELGKNPAFVGCRPFVVTLASNPEDERLDFTSAMKKRFGGLALPTSIDPDGQEIEKALEKCKGASSVVLCTYNGHVKKGQLKLAKALERENYAIVAMRNPYDLKVDAKALKIAAFEYSETSIDNAARVLCHEYVPEGELSVKL